MAGGLYLGEPLIKVAAPGSEPVNTYLVGNVGSRFGLVVVILALQRLDDALARGRLGTVVIFNQFRV